MILNILSPDQTILSAEVDEIVLDTVEGRLGILNRHAPVLGYLKEGKMRIRTKGVWQEIPSFPGILEVQNSKVTILFKS